MEQHQNKERLLTKPLALLTFGHLITDVGQGALPVLLPFLKTAFNLTYTQIGVVVLVQNLTSSVIQPLFGYLTDRVSLPWLIPASVLLAGIGTAIIGIMTSYYTLLAAVVVGGLGIACFHPQASKSAHLVSSAATKGRSMGLFSVGGNLGLAIGSIAMSFALNSPGVLTNTLYFIIPGLIMALLLYRNLQDISPTETAPQSAAASHAGITNGQSLNYGLLAILLGFVFIRSSIHTGLTTYIPLYYIDYLSGSPVYASYLLAVFLLAGVVGTYTGASLSDRFGRKTVIMGSILSTLPLIGLFQYTTGLATLIVLALTGLSLISSFATTVVLAQEMMPGYVGMASGLTIGFSIGLGGVGATILGYVADHFGVPSVFTVLSVLPIAGVVLASFLPGKLFKR
ncbi:MFS transporter [Sporomusa malonica]|uniref:MFS transporter, FSR family, fosmidomycin resistance protein n=1 Tax=Sporomusa malonica TaxID=112901 RepID=A0A1W2DU78_9FIRM|nr:MFS transporter [Sporomusa malonica]SMD01115.1 MFS transporter, FSR family, fosmidomycin resistance protein [Sporomusa malonica]